MGKKNFFYEWDALDFLWNRAKSLYSINLGILNNSFVQFQLKTKTKTKHGLFINIAQLNSYNSYAVLSNLFLTRENFAFISYW